MQPETTESTVNLTELLKLHTHNEETQEKGLMEFRIRGIDIVIDALKKTLDKEDKKALNNHLKMCPSIECLVEHLLKEYPESKDILETYLPKLHKKLA